MSWRERFEEVFGGNRAQAARVLAHDAKKARVPLDVAASSLATKIGELLAGESITWWRKRSALSKLFARLLGVEVADLLREIPVGALAIPEFPAIRPLQAEEHPCSL